MAVIVLKKIRLFVEKLTWAFFNAFPPRAVKYQKRTLADRNDKQSMIVVMIDYDKFEERKTKSVGNTSYPCGRAGLEFVHNYCRLQNIDFVNIITTDEERAPKSYDGAVNRTVYIRNGGSDIAALEAISSVIARYKFMIVVNSSANVNDAQNFPLIYRQVLNAPSEHFVIGYNGNSRISPRLPTAPALTPHIITNFFASPVIDVVATLAHARQLKLYSFVKGFANKYFAIRYFEVLLSRNAVFNDGMLILLRNDETTYYRWSNDMWPKLDSRLLTK